MKRKLEKWEGQFLINHQIKDNLDDEKFEPGKEFHIKLLSKRKGEKNESTSS